MTAADLLAPIRGREQAATEGPWGAYAGCIRQERSWRDPSEVVVDYGGERPSVPNALFIAAARTDIPRLLAALDAVEEQAQACAEMADITPNETAAAALRMAARGIRAAVVAALQEGE